ncbi:MAG: oligopeptide ABC transporter permease OppB [Alphaproteobacteria bacterium]|nr:oligopeptide ABC transporter permease OppB [Rhodospirillaceae bacterium]MBT6509777.1 oligopeptide ABC transporter permease OppB [Rhodospirillaceae bacterium]MBT7612386.1 oligopeptide ABC transporter permease OppB [Rhodospirillaceae bacterium]MDG2482299.1 oligopeptide ABC transporter permease OppB [Alphaproteobacteria bacterium]
MFGYAVRRLAGAVPTIFVVITISFFMIRLAPGGPFDQERKVPPEVEANLAAAYHLDEPLIEQYGRYLANILQGDFGPSFRYRDFQVSELLRDGFPVSMQLGLAAMILAVTLGFLAGSLAALKRNTPGDVAVMGLAMTGIAVPNFVVAPLMTLILGVWLSLLPVGGWGGLNHAVLPVIALALPQIAAIARLTRGSMLEVLRADFIRTARAKGLSEGAMVTGHALKAAALPVLSYLGPATAGIITGSVVIEQIFGIPGIGRYFVQGALNRDYTLVMGVVIFYAGLIITLNLIVDLLYPLFDPRVRND